MDGGAGRRDVGVAGGLKVAVAGKLRTDIGVSDPDGFYARLIELHQGLSQEQSNKVNAKLILLLANHIGDDEVLDEALAYIRRSLEQENP